MKSIVYLTLAIVFALTNSIPFSNGIMFSCAQVWEIPENECEALVALYNSTNIPWWKDHTNWVETNTPSNWYGVTVTYNHVTGIELPMNNLNGILPPEIGDFPSLTRLDLGGNQLRGNTPPELKKLTNLEYLSLDYNQYSGSIPPELGNLVAKILTPRF